MIDSFYKRNISSDKLWRQILGALFQWRTKPFLAFVFLLTPLSIGISAIMAPGSLSQCLLFIALNLVVWLIIKVCGTLSETFNLSRDDKGVTSCQIIKLAAIGLWIIGFILIFDIKSDGRAATSVGVIGVALGWILQDKVKGVAAFLGLRSHKQLNLGDWISVPQMGVDGEVIKITLTSITIYNWDTTTSTIPISALQANHFINLQNMSDGKTYGRKMSKTFIFDWESIRPVSQEEADSLKCAGEDFVKYIPVDEIKAGALNAHLFRLYIYHWLMGNSHISQRPRLIARWADQGENGLKMELHAFITDPNWEAFDWYQSEIVEHVVSSVELFGLKLYQSPSAYDARKYFGRTENE